MNNEDNKNIENRIKEAANTVFVRKGYEATKMGDIAAEAGISRTSLHYYFRNKETLFNAVLTQVANLIIPNLEEQLKQDGTLIEKLPAIIRAYNNLLKQNPGFPLFLLNELNRDPEHLYKAILQDNHRIETISKFRNEIIREMEQGDIKKIPLVNLLSTFLGLMIFPLLVRKPFTDAVLEGNEKAYDDFLENRESFVADVLSNLLKP